MVTRLIEGLSRVDEGIADVGWCLFILSTRKNVCCVLIDKGIIQAAFTRLEKLTNQQVGNESTWNCLWNLFTELSSSVIVWLSIFCYIDSNRKHMICAWCIILYNLLFFPRVSMYQLPLPLFGLYLTVWELCLELLLKWVFLLRGTKDYCMW